MRHQSKTKILSLNSSNSPPASSHPTTATTAVSSTPTELKIATSSSSTSTTTNADTVSVIPKRLNFAILTPQQISTTVKRMNSTKTVFYFSVENDKEFQYQPFYADFGPLSLLHVHKFLIKLRKLLSGEVNCPIVFYTSPSPNSVTNSIFLISSFLMIHCEVSPDKAYSPFIQFEHQLKPYRDASSLHSLYDLSVISCLRGLHRAIQIGWYHPDSFNAPVWERYEIVENGDMNWLIPGKLMAFASPYSTNVLQGGWKVCTPRDLVPVFKSFGITRVVRLCNKLYDETVFARGGLKFTELFFEDGTIPPERILAEFLQIMDSKDVIALHCKAGLGRTGTLAACYMIRNYSFTADESIGWIRICRPGSIIGPQQKYLIWFEGEVRRRAEAAAAAAEAAKAEAKAKAKAQADAKAKAKAQAQADAKAKAKTPTQPKSQSKDSLNSNDDSPHSASPSKHLRTTFQKNAAAKQKSSANQLSRSGHNEALAQSLNPQQFTDFRQMAVGEKAHDDIDISLKALQIQAKKAQPRKKKRALLKRGNE